MSEAIDLRPNPGNQELALRSGAKELLFGGKAGGGKSYALVAGAARWVENPNYRALLLRRTTKQLDDSLIPETERVYQLLGAKFNSQKLRWTFPSGATVRLGHMEHESSKYIYDGASYQFCVARGTPILMASGEWRPIESVLVGELVQTLIGPRRVLKTHAPGRKRVVMLRTKWADVVVSEQHRFLTASGWVSPVELMSKRWNECDRERGGWPEPSSSSGMPHGFRSMGPQQASEHGRPHQEESFLKASAASTGDAQSGSATCCGSPQERQLPPTWTVQAVLLERCLPIAEPRNAGGYLPCAQPREQIASSAPDSRPDCPCGPGWHDGRLHRAEGADRRDIPLPDGAEIRSQRSPSDGPENAQERTTQAPPLELRHPYSSEPMAVIEDVRVLDAEMVQAGEEEVHDLTVEEASHYVTWGGFIAQNCGFDELTHFYRSQYTFMFSRLRSAHGIPTLMRATTNPGGIGHEWVLERWAPWLYPPDEASYKGPRAEPGQKLYARRGPKGDVWCERDWHDPECQLCREKNPCIDHKPLSRTFVPGTMAPQLAGTGYEANLDRLDPIERRQKKFGDWMAKPAAGKVFQRANIPILQAHPTKDRVLGRVRFWDRAGTQGGGDWTAGVRMIVLDGGLFVVEDVICEQLAPAGVFALIKNTAATDPVGTIVGLEQDPGQAGKFEMVIYVRELVGYAVRVLSTMGMDKMTRAAPLAAQSSELVQNLAVMSGAWNDHYIKELNDFPDGDNDDQVDASSGAFRVLAPALNALAAKRGGVRVRVLGG